MQYVALSSVEESIRRVRKRAERGGHSAPPQRIREIYEASLKNLPQALKEFDYVSVFDNTDTGNEPLPALVLETVNGRLVSLIRKAPDWIVDALRGSEFDIAMPR